jgi:hypothetical protein
MKPSELLSAGPQSELPARKPKWPVDKDADPPISIEEALAAGGALCRRHGGIIGQRGDKEGMVFLCTGCGMYWRYRRPAHSWRKLKYPHNKTTQTGQL